MDNQTKLVQILTKEWELKLAENLSYEELQQQLAAFINHLMITDFNYLLQLLYRIDVSEEKLKAKLKEFPNTDAATIIAALVIERQLQKLKSRENFKNTNNEGANDEDLL